MIGLSLRPFFAALSACLLLAASAPAQVPLWQPPQPAPDAQPAPAPVPAAADTESASPAQTPGAPPMSGDVTPAPAAAAAPAQAGTPEPKLPESRQAPAKADVITVPAAGGHDDSERLEGESSLHPRRSWYGWQTLIADGASTSCFVAVGALASVDHLKASVTLSLLGLLGYEFAPGIIHFAHGHPGRGFASMGVRFGMPLAGAFVGASMASGCTGYECEAGGAALGLLAGMAGAIVMDAAVFAFDAARSGAPASPVAGLTPLVLVTPGRTWLGLSGRL